MNEYDLFIPLSLSSKKTKQSTKDVQTPTEIAYFKAKKIRITNISVGTHHNIVMDEKNNVYCWGWNSYVNVFIFQLLFLLILFYRCAQIIVNLCIKFCFLFNLFCVLVIRLKIRPQLVFIYVL